MSLSVCVDGMNDLALLKKFGNIKSLSMSQLLGREGRKHDLVDQIYYSQLNLKAIVLRRRKSLVTRFVILAFVELPLAICLNIISHPCFLFHFHKIRTATQMSNHNLLAIARIVHPTAEVQPIPYALLIGGRWNNRRKILTAHCVFHKVTATHHFRVENFAVQWHGTEVRAIEEMQTCDQIVRLRSVRT